MIFKILKALRSATKRRAPQGAATAASSGTARDNPATVLKARVEVPEWQKVVTESFRRTCVAPDDEIVAQSFDLWTEKVFATFYDRERHLADLKTDILEVTAAIQGYAPRLILNAMSRHPYQFAAILDQREVF